MNVKVEVVEVVFLCYFVKKMGKTKICPFFLVDFEDFVNFLSY